MWPSSQKDVAAEMWAVDRVLAPPESIALLKVLVLASWHLGCIGLSYSLFAGERGSSGALSVFRLGLLLSVEGWPRKMPWQEGAQTVGEALCGRCPLSRFQNPAGSHPGAEAAAPLGVIELPDPLDTPIL